MNALATPAKDLPSRRTKTTWRRNRLPILSDNTHFDETTWRNSFVTNHNTPFMIGNVEIPNRTVLTPMAGAGQLRLSGLAEELGAGLWSNGLAIQQRKRPLPSLHIDEGKIQYQSSSLSDEDNLARAAVYRKYQN